MSLVTWKNSNYITTWEQFDAYVRFQGTPLLKRLDEFPNSVLVTGCQRSGTTMLARLITQSSGMVNYWFGPDDELDAALILSGYVDHQPQGRYCFQTTYINCRCPEYFAYPNGNKIIFVLRNPFSVIYSMLYNWKDYALNSLFYLSGVTSLTGHHKWLYKFIGTDGVSRLYRACFAYNGKISQLYYLKETLGADQLMVVDYDDIVVNKEVLLPQIYDFIQSEYSPAYLDKIVSTSIKKTDKLSKREHSTISKLSLPIYHDLKKFTTFS